MYKITVLQSPLMCVPLIFVVHPRTPVIFSQHGLEAPLGPAAFWPRGKL